jgi:hypothetical protein
MNDPLWEEIGSRHPELWQNLGSSNFVLRELLATQFKGSQTMPGSDYFKRELLVTGSKGPKQCREFSCCCMCVLCLVADNKTPKPKERPFE